MPASIEFDTNLTTIKAVKYGRSSVYLALEQMINVKYILYDTKISHYISKVHYIEERDAADAVCL